MERTRRQNGNGKNPKTNVIISKEDKDPMKRWETIMRQDR
jgi:hypothetical protein